MLRHISIFAPLLLVLGGCGADVRSTLDRGQQKIAPVVTALEAYQKEHGTYPQSLDVLVKGGLLDRIPRLPNVRGTLGSRPLAYNRSPDGSFYHLSFAYDFPNGIGPAEFVTRYYVSDDQQWDTASYPPSFDSLVAGRSSRAYREKGSHAALKTSVDYLIKGSDHGTGCVNLFESEVRESLGQGEKVDFPLDFSEDENTEAFRYVSDDQDMPFYVFVFQKKVMPGMDAKRTISDREYKVVRTIHRVTQNENGGSDWKTIAECR